MTIRSAVVSICIDCLNISKTLHFTKTQCLYFRILLGGGGRGVKRESYFYLQDLQVGLCNGDTVRFL